MGVRPYSRMAVRSGRPNHTTIRLRSYTWSGLIRPILVVDEVGVRDVVRPGAESLPRMARDEDENLSDVVVVVALEQLVAEAGRIHVGTRLARRGHERWVDRDPDDVRPRRDGILAVATVEHEVLSAEVLVVGVGVADADPLEAGQRLGPTRTVHPGRHAAVSLPRRDVEHAETALCRPPGVAGRRIE